MVNPAEAIAMKIGWGFFWGGRTNQKPEIAHVFHWKLP
jgi:hypothetical protein